MIVSTIENGPIGVNFARDSSAVHLTDLRDQVDPRCVIRHRIHHRSHFISEHNEALGADHLSQLCEVDHARRMCCNPRVEVRWLRMNGVEKIAGGIELYTHERLHSNLKASR